MSLITNFVIHFFCVDQMTLGHLFLNSLFGSKGVPTVGWHIGNFVSSFIHSFWIHFIWIFYSLIDSHTHNFEEVYFLSRIQTLHSSLLFSDPFGHSSSQTRIFTQMGFNGHFFARIDYQDYFYRSAAKNLEFVWRGIYDFVHCSSSFLSLFLSLSYSISPFL